MGCSPSMFIICSLIWGSKTNLATENSGEFGGVFGLCGRNLFVFGYALKRSAVAGKVVVDVVTVIGGGGCGARGCAGVFVIRCVWWWCLGGAVGR